MEINVYSITMTTRLAGLVSVFLFAASSLLGGSITTLVSFQTNAPFLDSTSYIDFQFTQGDPAEVGSNTALVYGSNLLPGFSLTDGTVPGPGEQTFAFTPGSVISFYIQLTNNVTSTITPDLLSIYLLDSAYNPYDTTDPAGVGTLVSFTEPTDLNQSIQIGVYDTINGDFNTNVTFAPEPSTGLISGFVFVSVGVFCLIRRSRRADKTILCEGRQSSFLGS